MTYELFFECRESFRDKKTSHSQESYDSSTADEILIHRYQVAELSEKRCLDPILSDTKSLGPSDFELNLIWRYNTWRFMIETYYKLHLNLPADTFPALSG